MRQKYLTFLLSMLISMVGAKAFAHDIEVANEDGVTIYYNFINDDTELAVTCKGNDRFSYGYSGNIVIPSSVTYEDKTYSVTSIGDNAFYQCSISNIEIPNSVTSIGEEAFYRCDYLTSIEIPNSVTSIGNYAFYGCI